MLVIGAGFSGCEKTEKARFISCDVPLPPRDIVFIIDQSGTMYRNDPPAVRWEVVRNVAERVLNDEEKSVAMFRETIGDTLRTRFAIIPFGKDETPGYNKRLQWYTRENSDSLFAYLETWKKRSAVPKNSAKFSDFWSPLQLLSTKRLPWRTNVARYIFFLTDGRYNILPDIQHVREEKKYRDLLDSLQQRVDQWPVYFIGMGRPGLDANRREPNVNVSCLDSMARALPLPRFLHGNTPRPTFSEPDLVRPNLVAIISDDEINIRDKLQDELELVLRQRRSAQPDSMSERLSIFPVVDPGQAEITVEVGQEIIAAELASALQIFVTTKSKGQKPFPVLPASVASQHWRGYLHTLVVDTAELHQTLPEIRNLNVVQSWGLRCLEKEITFKRISLTIKDNWSVWVDRCDIVPVLKTRTWWRRLLRWPEPLAYYLVIDVRAVHPCGGVLPQARLRVQVQDGDKREQRGGRPRMRTWSPPGFNYRYTEHTYTWHLEMPHQEIFEKRIGWPVNIDIQIDDLYACTIHVPAEVPLNARPTSALPMTGVISKERKKI